MSFYLHLLRWTPSTERAFSLQRLIEEKPSTRSCLHPAHWISLKELEFSSQRLIKEKQAPRHFLHRRVRQLSRIGLGRSTLVRCAVHSCNCLRLIHACLVVRFILDRFKFLLVLNQIRHTMLGRNSLLQHKRNSQSVGTRPRFRQKVRLR